MTITIRDVAKKLNLSITTVSRALDGYEDVAEGTRLLVIQTAQEMGYFPNQAARQLRRRRTDTIGYIIPADKPRFSDPFFAEFTAGLGDETSANGFDLLVSAAPPGSQAEGQAYEKWVRSRKVDGVVLNRLRLNDWRVRFLEQSKFPFVTLERSPGLQEYQAIEMNGRFWFGLLLDHLASLGHKRIAYIGASPDLIIQVDRYRGYQDGLKRHGLPWDGDLVVEGDLTSNGGYRAGQHLLRLANPPTAITCVDDITAMGVLHAARDAGKVVGQDLAVAGFDGVEGFEHTQPPLTTVNQPVYHIARRLVQMLISQITGVQLSTTLPLTETVLEIRQSTTGIQEVKR